MLSGFEGPLAVGRKAINSSYTVTSQNSNGDLGWSMFDIGIALLDPRVGVNAEAPQNTFGVIGIGQLGRMLLVDATPAAVSTSNLAAAQAVTSGTPMTLVSTSANGINVLSQSMIIPQTMSLIPSGTLCIDDIPAFLVLGYSSRVQLPDPRTMIARAVSITGATSSPGGTFIVHGYDIYGQPQTEQITVPAASTTAGVTQNGKKGWKFISSVVPQFTTTYDYSVGTTDIYEFPVAAYEWAYLEIFWANALQTSSTVFTPADQTNPATSTTGSVRGTFTAPSASTGSVSLQVWQAIPPYALPAVNGAPSIFGVTPA